MANQNLDFGGFTFLANPPSSYPNDPYQDRRLLETIYLTLKRDTVSSISPAYTNIGNGQPFYEYNQIYHSTIKPFDPTEIINVLGQYLGHCSIPQHPSELHDPDPRLWIVVDDGDTFAGDIDQWKDVFFDNATRETIEEFCKDNNWKCEIEVIG